MNISAGGILIRDQFVLEQLVKRRIPTVVLASGGYSPESYRLISTTIAFILQTWGGAKPGAVGESKKTR